MLCFYACLLLMYDDTGIKFNRIYDMIELYPCVENVNINDNWEVSLHTQLYVFAVVVVRYQKICCGGASRSKCIEVVQNKKNQSASGAEAHAT